MLCYKEDNLAGFAETAVTLKVIWWCNKVKVLLPRQVHFWHLADVKETGVFESNTSMYMSKYD